MLRQTKNKAQTTIEFTFCMIIIFLMIYGMMKVFQWSGVDLAERRIAHETVLTGGGGPRAQIDPHFSVPQKMNAIWTGF